jgi:SAM-dependent methyltransferase
MPDVKSNAVDFVCNSHVLEHTPNPGLAVEEWLRVVKPGGLIYMIIPDMRFSYDRARVLTQPVYMVERFLRREITFRRDEFQELVYLSGKGEFPERSEAVVDAQVAAEWMGHMHTFTGPSALEFFCLLRPYLGFDVVLYDCQDINIHLAIKKR